MNEFNFRYQGFRTIYKAVPAEQTYNIFVGNDHITHFEQGEMQQMIAAGKILKMFDREGDDEAAE